MNTRDRSLGAEEANEMMKRAIMLTEDEAFALLHLALASSQQMDDSGEEAVAKLVSCCRSFLASELEAVSR